MFREPREALIDERRWGDTVAKTVTSTGAGVFHSAESALVHIDDVPRVWCVRLGVRLTSPIPAGDIFFGFFKLRTGVGQAQFEQQVSLPIPGPIVIGPDGFVELSQIIDAYPAKSIQIVAHVRFQAAAVLTVNGSVSAGVCPYTRLRNDQ